jgi:hypothetical protein
MDIINKELAKKQEQQSDSETETFFEYLSANENVTPKSMAIILLD